MVVVTFRQVVQRDSGDRVHVRAAARAILLGKFTISSMETFPLNPSAALGEPAEMFLSSAGRELLLAGVVGSTAYGLHRQGSDIDRLGIYQATTISLLGLNGGTNPDETFVANEPDVTLHELGKFFRLAMRANPTVTEMLWLDAYEVLTDGGRALVEARRMFLSTASVKAAYVGYATEQSKRVTQRGQAGSAGFAAGGANRTAKHGRHCARLLIGARELLTTGELHLDVSEHRDRIFALGDLAVNDPERFTAIFEAERGEIDSLDSVLPDRVNVDTLEALLIELRLTQLQNSGLGGKSL